MVLHRHCITLLYAFSCALVVQSLCTTLESNFLAHIQKGQDNQACKISCIFLARASSSSPIRSRSPKARGAKFALSLQRNSTIRGQRMLQQRGWVGMLVGVMSSNPSLVVRTSFWTLDVLLSETPPWFEITSVSVWLNLEL